MKYKIAIIVIAISLSIFLTLGTVFAYKFYQFAKTFQPVESDNISEYQLVYTCEQLSSQATNENWDYGACIENLTESLKKSPILKI